MGAGHLARLHAIPLAVGPDQTWRVGVLILRQAVPLGYLATRVLADLPPVVAGRARRRRSQHQAAEDGVGAARVARVRVQQQQLHAGVPQGLAGGGQVEDEELVEDGVGGALLHVGLLLAHALLSLVHVHLDVRV